MIVLHILTSANQPECNCNVPVGQYHKPWCDALKAPEDRTGPEA